MLSTVEFSISQALGSPREAPMPGFEPGLTGLEAVVLTVTPHRQCSVRNRPQGHGPEGG